MDKQVRFGEFRDIIKGDYCVSLDGIDLKWWENKKKWGAYEDDSDDFLFSDDRLDAMVVNGIRPVSFRKIVFDLESA